jgi:hypothetical protein
VGTYEPELGDLVFFEPDRHVISKLVASLSRQPIRDLTVSHCAIVSKVNSSSDVVVIENTLHRKESRPDGDSRHRS